MYLKDFYDIMSSPIDENDKATFMEMLNDLHHFTDVKLDVDESGNYIPIYTAKIEKIISSDIDAETIAKLKNNGWFIKGDNIVYKLK